MFEITKDRSNKDMPVGVKLADAKDYYLDLYKSIGRKNFSSKLGTPPVEDYNGRKVLRCDKVGGLKAIAIERYLSSIDEDVVVYCAPRVGHAAHAIAKLSKMYKKKAVFFAPASAVPTAGQICVKAYGHDLRFVKIAAMPVLNSYAKTWAKDNGAKFLPFGLSGVPAVTAGIIHMADKISTPTEFWCATSTGTMIRALQIAWPIAKPMSVAVARNMHVGEIGRADIVSSDLPFLKESRTATPFPSTRCYDAKAWERCLSHGRKGSLFINVGNESEIYADAILVGKVDGHREWGDFSDLERGL